MSSIHHDYLIPIRPAPWQETHSTIQFQIVTWWVLNLPSHRSIYPSFNDNFVTLCLLYWYKAAGVGCNPLYQCLDLGEQKVNARWCGGISQNLLIHLLCFSKSISLTNPHIGPVRSIHTLCDSLQAEFGKILDSVFKERGTTQGDDDDVITSRYYWDLNRQLWFVFNYFAGFLM